MEKFKRYLLSFIFGLIAPASAFADDGLPSQDRDLAAVLTTSGTCPATKLSYAQSDDINQATTSTSFVDVPGMVRTVTIPGSTRTCVEVQYTATVFSPEDELIYVQATRDGFPCLPPNAQFEGDSDEDADGAWARAHAFNFICTGVTPGAHVFKIQWRSFFGGTVFTHWRSMVVHHK